ncbi:MAG: hypothetical protein J6Y01_10155, partial [Spirochaetales bacterium]|nr:hypothetical protein [Spirochaetales bacterium]
MAVLRSQLADIDAITDVSNLRPAFFNTMMFREKPFNFDLGFENRNKKYLTLWFTATKLLPRSSDTEITLAEILETEDTDEPYKKLTLYRELFGLTDATADNAHIQSLLSFVEALTNEDNTSDKTDFEDAFVKYLNDNQIDTTDLEYDDNGMFNRLNLIGTDGMDELSLENAKTLLKYCIANYGLDVILNKQKTLRSYVYIFPLIKAYKEIFDPNGSKQKYVKTMCEDLRQTFEKRLTNNTWMSASSKAKALKKLKEMYLFCGYPESFPDEIMPSENKYSSCTTFLDFYETINDCP